MGILDKMNRWDTWEDMEKDLVPYFTELFAKSDDDPFVLIKEMNILKEIIHAVHKSFYQLYDEMRGPLKAYNFWVEEVYKMPGNILKLTELLNSYAHLLDDYEKNLILSEWYDPLYFRNKTKGSSASEDLKKMKKSFKIKITAFSEAAAEMKKFLPRRKAMIRLFQYTFRVKDEIAFEFPSYKFEFPSSYEVRSSSFRLGSSSRKDKKVRKNMCVEDNIRGLAQPLKKAKPTPSL